MIWQFKLTIIALSISLVTSKAVDKLKPNNALVCQKSFSVFKQCFNNLVTCMKSNPSNIKPCVRRMKYCAIGTDCVKDKVCYNKGYVNTVNTYVNKVLLDDNKKHIVIAGLLGQFASKCKANGQLDMVCVAGLVDTMKKALDNYDVNRKDAVFNDFQVCFGDLYRCKQKNDAKALAKCAQQMVDCALLNTLRKSIMTIAGDYPAQISSVLMKYFACCGSGSGSVKCAAKNELNEIAKAMVTAKCP